MMSKCAGSPATARGAAVPFIALLLALVTSLATAQDAVYYARAVENPSCRWSTRLCLSLPEGDRPDGCDNERIPKVIQERAWTAPIWYEASTLIQ